MVDVMQRLDELLQQVNPFAELYKQCLKWSEIYE
jgi:hypothetical protein